MSNGPRQLAKVFGPLHNVVYYSPEVKVFNDAGFRGFWHAYFVYRAAPMGEVPAAVVTSVFYNFAPRMVERALPAGWQIMGAARALEVRLDVVDRALGRVLGADAAGAELADLASLARAATEGAPWGGRPLYAAHAALPWPDRPHLALWHAATLLREHRGDSHVIALAAADVSPVACHVLMAQTGHGNRASILPIRGWTEKEWAQAEDELAARGWLGPRDPAVGGARPLTDAGRAARKAIEEHTDRLTIDPSAVLGPDDAARLVAGMGDVLGRLVEGGVAHLTWPPPHLLVKE